MQTGTLLLISPLQHYFFTLLLLVLQSHSADIDSNT